MPNKWNVQGKPDVDIDAIDIGPFFMCFSGYRRTNQTWKEMPKLFSGTKWRSTDAWMDRLADRHGSTKSITLAYGGEQKRKFMPNTTVYACACQNILLKKNLFPILLDKKVVAKLL